ncbi:MAG: metal ABC transporter permease, partial [Thermodesulfobacteriota bacterium]|nr:metal ABC transporter permease [Thermodesulfobacteriota bacterium]
MAEFIADLQQQTFLQYALLTGLLASIACGVIGSYVVTRRITYIAGGIAHSVLAGMGAARYCETVYNWKWLHPLYGAVVAALVAAIIIGLVSLRARQREDTVIGAVWAIGMAIGILFIFKTPGYNEDLMSYLFGSILMVSANDLWLIAGLDVLIVTVVLVFYRQFLAVCFDEEFARLRGIRVEFYYLMLLCLIALTVVLLVTVVGIVMVIALLTLPAAIAGKFSKKL